MSNIVLNNYNKNKKNACQHEKRSTKKKLTTLNNWRICTVDGQIKLGQK
jgi:hypothetical protein